MSTPARRLQSTSRSQELKPELLSREGGRELLDEFNNLVARRAYDRFEQDGRADGNDLSHWLDAESEFESPLPEVRESGDSISVDIPLPQISVENVKLYATEDRAIIYYAYAENDSRSANEAGGAAQSGESTYYIIRWPEIIDPASCSAELEDENLTLTVRKADSWAGGAGAQSREL
jgi:HSP20 family molecular chaperone IbpA